MAKQHPPKSSTVPPVPLSPPEPILEPVRTISTATTAPTIPTSIVPPPDPWAGLPEQEKLARLRRRIHAELRGSGPALQLARMVSAQVLEAPAHWGQRSSNLAAAPGG